MSVLSARNWPYCLQCSNTGFDIQVFTDGDRPPCLSCTRIPTADEIHHVRLACSAQYGWQVVKIGHHCHLHCKTPIDGRPIKTIWSAIRWNGERLMIPHNLRQLVVEKRAWLRARFKDNPVILENVRQYTVRIRLFVQDLLLTHCQFTFLNYPTAQMLHAAVDLRIKNAINLKEADRLTELSNLIATESIELRPRTQIDGYTIFMDLEETFALRVSG